MNITVSSSSSIESKRICKDTYRYIWSTLALRDNDEHTGKKASRSLEHWLNKAATKIVTGSPRQTCCTRLRRKLKILCGQSLCAAFPVGLDYPGESRLQRIHRHVRHDISANGQHPIRTFMLCSVTYPPQSPSPSPASPPPRTQPRHLHAHCRREADSRTSTHRAASSTPRGPPGAVHPIAGLD